MMRPPPCAGAARSGTNVAIASASAALDRRHEGRYTSGTLPFVLYPCQAAAPRLISLVLVLGIAACHVADDTITLPTVAFPTQANLRHVTFNLGPDVTPLWSPDGTMLSYVAQGQPPASIGQWLRWRIPVEGGIAGEELQPYRTGGSIEPLPVLRAPTGTLAALAFVRLFQGVDCGCGGEPWPMAKSLVVAALDLAAALPAFDALPQFEVALVGRQVADSVGRPLYRVSFTPALARRRDDLSAAFGPSWAPDGSRLVVSDGDRLWTWRVSGGTPAPVPGVADAAFPRWSPDGTRIAFVRYPQDSVRVTSCVFWADSVANDAACFANHRTTVTSNAEVWVVAPDGSGLARVGLGEESAWLPSSNALLVRRGTGLVLVDLTNSTEQPIDNTVGAMEPSVSPDGRRAAFVARFSGNQDLWTVELP